MQNIAEFRIIGRVGSVDTTDKVTHVSVAANYNRKDGDEWKTDTDWNRVTFFRRLEERPGGKEAVRPWRPRWGAGHSSKKEGRVQDVEETLGGERKKTKK